MQLFNFSTLAAVLLFVTATSATPANFQGSAASTSDGTITGAYIVKLREGTSTAGFLGSTDSLTGQDGRIQHAYDNGAFQGFAGKFSEEEVAFLQNDERVEFVEPQVMMHITGSQSNPPSWGLPRISQRRRNLSAPYLYPDNAGRGIDVWVIDTGIQPSHTDFGGRASQVKSFISGESNVDLNGHGTHVAGTIGSKTYGVAKEANIYGVKVLDADGSGTNAGVIAGIEYVTKNARPGKSVVNMSLGGSRSAALNAAVAAAVDAGVAFVVAAGNERTDACYSSPASSTAAFTVASTDDRDRQSTFSNYGQCVNIYAPGTDITSLWIGSNGRTDTISGTSMASPHVAGVAALYLATGRYSSVDALYRALSDNATPDVVTRAGSRTPNKLIYNQP